MSLEAISGFRVSFSDQGFDVSYRLPETIDARLSEATTLKVVFGWKGPTIEHVTTEMTLAQRRRPAT